MDMALRVQTRLLRTGFFEDPPTDLDGKVIQSEAQSNRHDLLALSFIRKTETLERIGSCYFYWYRLI